MKHEIRIRTDAQREITEAAEWYENQQAGLGGRFLDALDRTIELIREYPAMYRKVQGPLRRSLVRRFPYAVYYYFNESKITIVAVVHTKRHPRIWQSRLS